MKAQTAAQPVLLVGGSGKTGRRIADRLTSRGVAVRIGSRWAEQRFDWLDRSSWRSALDGASAAYITYYPDLAVPGAAAAVDAFSRQAMELGVRRLVLLSGRGEPEAQHAEEMLKATGADWTILRCAWFSQNFSEGFFLDQILAGVLALPVGDVREPFLDVEDIADIAAKVLTEDGHVGKLYELTGPRLLTFAEAIAEISAASGRIIRFEQISADEFRDGLRADNVPEESVDFLMTLFREVLDGRNESLTDGVFRALQRQPRDFADYAKQSAATRAWAPAPQSKPKGA
jgi:uncharacterized protein YbjT (DUF2867 family)